MSVANNSSGRQRRSKNSFTSRSGKAIKLHQSLSDRLRASKYARDSKKATYLSTLPKNPVLRALYRFQPRRLAQYWFSREGAIMALKLLGVGLVVVFLLTIGVFAYFSKDLPRIKDISGNNVGGSITYYDRTGQTVLWQDYGAVKRIPVESNQISPYVKEATVAIEDKDFYKHGAIDVRGILRAGLSDVLGGASAQGGSTITQQLVKNDQGWTYDHTYTRKAKEIILAIELEREYSKDDILTGYLNVVPYGSVDRGVETAARDYFGVSAKDLTLPQAAMLAAIPQAPTLYSPFSSPKYNPGVTVDMFDPQALIGRQEHILDLMAEQGMITKQQAADAKKVDVLAQVQQLAPSKYQGIKAPYFVLAAKAELEDKYGTAAIKQGGWKVITTVNLDLQKLADDQIQKDLPQIERQGGNDAAFAAEDVKTGQMVALVGGVDFNNPDYGKLNFGHDVAVSPGSSFKPYDATTFIENNNAGAGSVMYDQEGPLPGYPCTDKAKPVNGDSGTGNCLWDYDFSQPGPITLRYALGGSRNIPWVKAMLSAVPSSKSQVNNSVINQDNITSINKVISTADALMGNPNGYKCYVPGADVFAARQSDETQCYGSSAIGDGAYIHLDDHVNGLASLARLGVELPRTYILKITDSSDKVIYQWQQPKGTQVVRPDSAYIVDNMASDPNASYLSGLNKFHRYHGWDFAIKTGTTNFKNDGLMASWSTQYAAVTWVGSGTRTKILTGAMENMTGPVIRGWMEGAHDMLHTNPVNWTQPSDIQTLPAYVVRTHVGLGSNESAQTGKDIFPSWYKPKSGGNSSQTIDKVSGKLATNCTPDAAKEVQNNSNASSFSVDAFVSGALVSNATGPDDIHSCSDTPPSVSAPSANDCDNQTKLCNFTVTATQGTHALAGGSYTSSPAGTLALLVNGNVVQTVNIDPSQGSPYSYTFNNISVNNGDSVTARVYDSVLYQATSEASTVTLAVVPGNGHGHDG